MLIKVKSPTTGNPLVYYVEEPCEAENVRHRGVLMASFMRAVGGEMRWHLDVNRPSPVYAPPDVVEFYEAMPFDKAVDYREEAWRNA